MEFTDSPRGAKRVFADGRVLLFGGVIERIVASIGVPYRRIGRNSGHVQFAPLAFREWTQEEREQIVNALANEGLRVTNELVRVKGRALEAYKGNGLRVY